MIDGQGWAAWGNRIPGPVSKLGYFGGSKFYAGKLGIIPHSAEGWRDYLLGTLLTDPNRQASVCATNMVNGDFYQHYPVTAVTWTSGSPYPNTAFIAIENEGLAGQPLTEPQVVNLTRFTRDCKDYFGWQGFARQDALQTGQGWEHQECVRWGSDPTACPSGRIPWDRIIAMVNEEEADMTPDEHQRLVNIENAIARIEVAMYGDQVWNDAPGAPDKRWQNVIQRLEDQKAEIAALRAEVAKTGGATLAGDGAHTHGHNV